nr:hypothetical protein [uncultured Cohaesibacter sp.]
MIARDRKRIEILKLLEKAERAFDNALVALADRHAPQFRAFLLDAPSRMSRLVLRYALAINLRQLMLQTGLYCVVLGFAVGSVLVGSRIMFTLIHQEMSEMSQDVVRANLPKEVEAANLRPAMQLAAQ